MNAFEKFLMKIRAGDIDEILFILLMISIGSAYFSFAGMALDSTGFLDTAGASIFGVLSGCAIWLVWYVAFRVLPSLTSRKFIMMAWTVLVLAMMMIFWLSSALNATAFRGKQAVELHMKHSIVIMQEGFEKISIATDRLRGIVATSADNSIRFYSASDEEFRSGSYSGSPGKGAIEGTMRTIGDRFENNRKMAQDFLDEVDAITLRVNTAIEQMRNIQKSDRPLIERQNMIMAIADKTRSDIRKVDGRVLAAAVSRSLSVLPAEVDLRVTLSRNPAVAARQKQGLERLKSDLKNTALPIIAYADEIANAEPVIVEPFETVTPSQAVLRYWYAFIPQWVAALALDMSPMIALIMLTIALKTKTEKELVELEILSTPMGMVLRVKALEELTRTARLHQDHARALQNRALGYDANDGDPS